jgi:serine/threonine protein kinase
VKLEYFDQQSGEPMLTDLGIAKILTWDPGIPDLDRSRHRHAFRRRRSRHAGKRARADVYALVVFYEMVTGRRPYVADTPVAVMFKHIMDPLPNPSQYAPGLPEVVEQVLIKTLAKQPADRYQTMELLVEALENLTGSATRMDEPLQPPVTAIDPSPAPLPVREPACHHRQGAGAPGASPMRAGQIPLSAGHVACGSSAWSGAAHTATRRCAVPQHLRSRCLKLAVVLTLLILGMITT